MNIKNANGSMADTSIEIKKRLASSAFKTLLETHYKTKLQMGKFSHPTKKEPDGKPWGISSGKSTSSYELRVQGGVIYFRPIGYNTLKYVKGMAEWISVDVELEAKIKEFLKK